MRALGKGFAAIGSTRSFCLPLKRLNVILSWGKLPLDQGSRVLGEFFFPVLVNTGLGHVAVGVGGPRDKQLCWEAASPCLDFARSCACSIGMWHSQEGVPGPQCPPQCSWQPQQSSPAHSEHPLLWTRPHRHSKLLPCHTSGCPWREHLEQEHLSTAPGPQPSRHGSLPHSTGTQMSRVWKLKMQSEVTCELHTSLAPAMLGKHRGHPALPVAAPLLPRSRAVAWGTSGEQGMVCTGCARWICCDTTSRSPVFIWLLYNFSPEQTPDQSTRRSQKQSRREHGWGHWTVSDVTKQWGVPSPGSRASQTRVILGYLEPVAKLTPRSKRAFPTSLISSSGILIMERD